MRTKMLITTAAFVLAAGDPLAMALLARYNNVPMPNMQLNDVEVAAILEHIREESDVIEKHVRMGHRRDPLAPRQADMEQGDHMDHGGHEGHGR